MTREEVRTRRAELTAQRVELDAARKRLRTEGEILALQCGHPDKKYSTDMSGTRFAYCDDCGWER